MAKSVRRSDSAKNPPTVAVAKRRAAAAVRRFDTESREANVRQDRWVNPATGIGTAFDKTRAAFFESPFRLMDTEITALANGNDLAAKLIEKRPDEMFRRGYELEPVKTGDKKNSGVTASDLKELLDYANEELEFDARFKQSIKYGRQYGGSLLVMAIDDGRMPWQPVDENNIKSIRALNQIDRRFAYVQSYYSDYLRPKYGQARTYLISNGVATSALRDDDDEGEFYMQKTSPRTLQNNGFSILNVHESRVLRFSGVETDVITRQQLAGWSWSQLQRPYEVLRQTDSCFDSLCYLISDASQAVMKLKGLFRAMESGNKQALEQRMKTLEMTRSVMRGIALDAGGEEDFTRVATPLTGIPDSIDRMMQRCAAAFDMPLTELFGMSPAGLNATGESDRIKWYATISSDQQNFLSPQQLRVLRLIMLAKDSPMRGRAVPIKIHYHPLYSPTDDEVAKTRLANAQRDAVYIEMGGPVTPDVVALTLTDIYSSLNPEDIEADMAAKVAFDPHENDPINSAGAQALAEGHPAVQGVEKPGGGVKVKVPTKPKPDPATLVRAVGGAAGTGGEGAGGAGEAQSPTVPLPGSSLHGGAVAPAGEGTGTPGDTEKKPANQKAAKTDAVDPGPNVAKDVYNQLRKDFGNVASSWALAAQWQGPKEVDLSRIDFSTENTWRATRDPDKVTKFSEKLDKLAPVILIDRRGSDLLDPCDGHHRILAYKLKGLPVVAYVASVQCKDGPWTDLHTMVQKPGGESVGGEQSRQSPRGAQSRAGENEGSRFTEHHDCDEHVARWDDTHEHFAGEFEGAARATAARMSPEDADLVKGYAVRDYRDINHVLKGKTKDMADWAIQASREKANALKDALERAPKYAGPVLRGALMSKAALEKFKPGAEVTNRTFWSTTTNPMTADDFAAGHGRRSSGEHVVLHISQHSGVAVSALSSHPEEREVLLSPGHSFHVSKVEGSHVYLEESGAGGKAKAIDRADRRVAARPLHERFVGDDDDHEHTGMRADDTHEHFAGEFEGMHDGSKEVKQSGSTKAEVMAGARQGHEHQVDFMAKMASDLGAHTARLDTHPGREREELKAGLDKRGPLVVIGPVKSEKRANEKAEKENGGDWSRMGDIVRSTIAVDKVSEMKPMIAKLKDRMSKEGVTLARAPGDRFAKPIDGYRDVLLNVKYPGGHVGELQLHVKPMLRAKELGGGHKLYEESRTIRGKAEGEKRDHTPAEKETLASNAVKSRAIYEPAIEEARR